MCGRYTLTVEPEVLAEAFGVEAPLDFSPRFNAAPGQRLPTVERDPDTGARRLRERRWGLVPGWAKDPGIGFRLINARAETVAEKPAFRDAFAQRRCLVPADGFYEWTTSEPGVKQPHHIGLAGGGVFAMAGLFEAWRSQEGALVESFSIVTTEANERLAPIHSRMPVILPAEDHEAWLDTRQSGVPLLRAYPSEGMTTRTVSPRVNDANVDDATCLEAYVPPPPAQGSLF